MRILSPLELILPYLQVPNTKLMWPLTGWVQDFRMWISLTMNLAFYKPSLGIILDNVSKHLNVHCLLYISNS